MNKSYLTCCMGLFVLFAANVFAKPNIWIHTDGTAVLGYTKTSTKAEADTDQDSDPDDQVALTQYLMLANRFNTIKIVMGVTNRNTQHNPEDTFNTIYRPAYAEGLTSLNQVYGGYPPAESFDVVESSCTAGSSVITFSDSPDDKYDNYNNLPGTVQDLVDELKKPDYSYEDPLYLCVWGGMTEAAMAVKHLIRNNETAALNRLFVVSHWHSSYTNTQGANGCYSGDLAEIYGCANCNVNCQSCRYLRNQAKDAGAQFRWVDCASVGQTGIVNGFGGFFTGGIDGTIYNQFSESALGDLFVKSKFAYGKPDGSDCATFYTVLGTYGVTLGDYSDNGQTTAAQESFAKNTFDSYAHTIAQELLDISDVAAQVIIDTDPPTPNPATWAAAPTVVNNTTVTMTATTGTDALSEPVEYYFDETTGNCNAADSDWQTSPIYLLTGLAPGTEYCFQVKMRDARKNETGYSTQQCVTTTGTLDVTAPSPVGFDVPPMPLSQTSITMTALTATDDNGPVEYKFTETTGNPGGTDSNWQTDSSYTDSGLHEGVAYAYTVQTRDTACNESAPSETAGTRTIGDADLNEDKKVDLEDVAVLSAQWASTLIPVADINVDGTVDADDLKVVAADWMGGTTQLPQIEDFENFTVLEAAQDEPMLEWADAVNLGLETGGWIFCGETDSGFTVQPTGGPDDSAYLARDNSSTAYSRGFAWVVKDDFQTTGTQPVEFDYLFQEVGADPANGGGMCMRITGISPTVLDGPWAGVLDGNGGSGQYGNEWAARYRNEPDGSSTDDLAPDGTYLLKLSDRLGDFSSSPNWQHKSTTVNFGTGYEWIVIHVGHNFQSNGLNVPDPHLYFGIDNVKLYRPVPPEQPEPIPAPWQSQDIGTPIPGSAAWLPDSQIFTLDGNGNDIWNQADSFYYVYQPLSGDGSITAKVLTHENTNSFSLAGVMIRQSLDADSIHAMMALRPVEGCAYRWRSTTAGSTSQTWPKNGAIAPYWVRLTRSGNTFTGQVSPDGTTWTTIETQTLSMTADTCVGLAVCSHDAATLCTATFSDVSID